MSPSFVDKLYQRQQACPTCPPQSIVSEWFESLLGCLFPDHAEETFDNPKEFELYFQSVQLQLEQILSHIPVDLEQKPEHIVANVFEKLPEVLNKLDQDVEALLAGDPAAQSTKEVIRAYPGFYAIASQRIAHELYQLKVPLIPRLITENAHSKTGIDIHPGAQIGRHFCIDHGTGVVIGETTVIGDHVKIYQGVTLGGLSVDKKDAKVKRHPTIGDHVVIYAGATILGGETNIGHDSIIGGNVWLTHSVPASSKIYYKAQMTNSVGETDTIIFKGQSA